MKALEVGLILLAVSSVIAAYLISIVGSETEEGRR